MISIFTLPGFEALSFTSNSIFISSIYVFMEKLKTVFKAAWPYKDDKMNLPVENVETSIPFYTTIMGFHFVSNSDSPFKSAILERDGIQIGLSENGGDPSQEGCFFEVDDVEAAFRELRANGLEKEISGLIFKPMVKQHGRYFSLLHRMDFVMSR